MKRKTEVKSVEEKLDRALALLSQLVAIELAKGGVSHAGIGKLLGISTGSANGLIKGYKPSGAKEG
jgi:predicted transcriptional regulator